jgi:hypothetical protein
MRFQWAWTLPQLSGIWRDFFVLFALGVVRDVRADGLDAEKAKIAAAAATADGKSTLATEKGLESRVRLRSAVTDRLLPRLLSFEALDEVRIR